MRLNYSQLFIYIFLTPSNSVRFSLIQRITTLNDVNDQNGIDSYNVHNFGYNNSQLVCIPTFNKLTNIATRFLNYALLI